MKTLSTFAAAAAIAVSAFSAPSFAFDEDSTFHELRSARQYVQSIPAFARDSGQHRCPATASYVRQYERSFGQSFTGITTIPGCHAGFPGLDIAAEADALTTRIKLAKAAYLSRVDVPFSVNGVAIQGVRTGLPASDLGDFVVITLEQGDGTPLGPVRLDIDPNLRNVPVFMSMTVAEAQALANAKYEMSLDIDRDYRVATAWADGLEAEAGRVTARSQLFRAEAQFHENRFKETRYEEAVYLKYMTVKPGYDARIAVEDRLRALGDPTWIPGSYQPRR